MLLEKPYAESNISLSGTTLPEDAAIESGVPLCPFKHTSETEGNDHYQWVVCELSDRWRVIVCKDRKQWILQYRDSLDKPNRWRGEVYCAFKSSLLREVKDRVGMEVRLPDLPEHISDYQS